MEFRTSRSVVEATKELISKYRQVAKELPDVPRVEKLTPFRNYLQEHTGFNNSSTCILCATAGHAAYAESVATYQENTGDKCTKCIYPDHGQTYHCVDTASYRAILTYRGFGLDQAYTDKDWIRLINNRADYLEERIKRLESGDLMEYLED